jgi:hypothetical protein
MITQLEKIHTENEMRHQLGELSINTTKELVNKMILKQCQLVDFVIILVANELIEK